MLLTLSVALIAASVALFGNVFAGPAPLVLAAAGGLIVWGVSLWRPPRN